MGSSTVRLSRWLEHGLKDIAPDVLLTTATCHVPPKAGFDLWWLATPPFGGCDFGSNCTLMQNVEDIRFPGFPASDESISLIVRFQHVTCSL